MGKAKPSYQAKETRVFNFNEVSLGFHKKVTQEEARRCPQCAVASCLPGCPLGIDIPGFIRFLREGDAVSALERIKKSNPFPAICGRICPAPCERACIFHHEGAAIGIRNLERYAADFGKPKAAKKIASSVHGKKIAIIGSGPSGLAAACFLVEEGFAVTIFESMPEAGGLLRYGIPEFRLPQKVLDDQIADMKGMGIEIQTNVFVGKTLTVQEIFMQGFGAILLAVGAGLPDFSTIEGENLGGVYYAEELLMRLQFMNKEDVKIESNLFRGDITVVVGGSASAIDAARLSLRLGQKVHLVFPGLEEQMEAQLEDVKSAVEEGLVIESPIDPISIDADDNDFASALRCRRLEIIEAQEGLSLAPGKEADFSLLAQTIVLAHGRRPNTFIKTSLPQLTLNGDGSIWVDPLTGQTGVDKIFACGNVVTGAGAVVDAIASAKKAAAQMVQLLKG